MSAVDCVSGCLTEGGTSAGLPCEGPAAGPPLADETSSRAHKGRVCGICGRCVQQSCVGAVQPAGATEPYRHSRFHPVPTRPVFSPRHDCLSDTEANVAPYGAALSLGTIDSCKAPPVEEIPAPAPEKEEGWRAKNPPQSGDGGSGSTLSPPVELKLGPIARNQSD